MWKAIRRQMELERHRCQSCGMPLRFDPQGGGSEADGTRSPHWCSFCYAEGALREPGLSLSEMQARVDGLLRKRKAGKFARLYMRLRLRTLRRWRR
ncbi:zinc ribbon domain-containing protein [Acidihalobacter ferrooxydans]|uniref:Putative zinc ribbon domain-containing protein n=1 Tax=Acidihalobacter ferrooxydans TaxID=1765967 RepID=A0A1P8UDN7_9GAMM|nr:zinc ribbon domain-containing protein [Acidihalobacter ferrooxydans]APZ41889.1 hypothetical protein BW247_01230 [Acidihalobacter ferrooxydans]